MSNDERRLVSRAVAGATEGALWGGGVGLMRSVIQLFRDPTPWFPQLVGPVLAGVVVGSIVCCIGRAISGRLLGAWIGAIAGAFLGLFFLGDLFGGYWWTETVEQPHGSFTSRGRPVGPAIGMVVGGLTAAPFGALLDRLLRPSDRSSEAEQEVE